MSLGLPRPGSCFVCSPQGQKRPAGCSGSADRPRVWGDPEDQAALKAVSKAGGHGECVTITSMVLSAEQLDGPIPARPPKRRPDDLAGRRVVPRNEVLRAVLDADTLDDNACVEAIVTLCRTGR